MNLKAVIHAHHVPPGTKPERIVDYIKPHFSVYYPSRASVKKAVKKGLFRVDGVIAGTAHWVLSGQKIDLLADDTPSAAVYPLVLDILYEDSHMAVIIKPAGIEVSGHSFRNLVNALPYNLFLSTCFDALPAPLPAHRLDFKTSGVMLVAKTRSALTHLSRQFQERVISKTYQAVVIGKAPVNGEIKEPINGREAYTIYECEQQSLSAKFGYLTHVVVKPLTGRHHQIRKHMASIGHAVLGDDLYSPAGQLLKHKGLFLASTSVQFLHPFNSKHMTFSMPAPAKFHAYVKHEYSRWNQAHPAI